MNFLTFDGMVGNSTALVTLSDQTLEIPGMISGAAGALTLGVRPENVHFDDAANYRGRITAAEYLGTTQIVTLDTPNGPLKARIGSDKPVRIGDTTGLRFDARSITLFDTAGKALISHTNKWVLSHG